MDRNFHFLYFSMSHLQGFLQHLFSVRVPKHPDCRIWVVCHLDTESILVALAKASSIAVIFGL